MLLLHAIRQGGLEEVDSLRFHRLQFFSNSLAPIYGTRPPVELVMKLERGPYYPDAQDDIDSLCVCGLASVRALRWHGEGKRVWKTAIYALTAEGYRQAVKLISGSLWCEQVAEFLHDLVMAYSDLSDPALDAVALTDLTYAQKGRALGDVIAFDMERNLSVRCMTEDRDRGLIDPKLAVNAIKAVGPGHEAAESAEELFITSCRRFLKGWQLKNPHGKRHEQKPALFLFNADRTPSSILPEAKMRCAVTKRGSKASRSRCNFLKKGSLSIARRSFFCPRRTPC
jgi:hypothetical protein